MAIGIEKYRALVTEKGALENRRVTADEVRGEIEAPRNLWGRIVHWIKGESVGEGRADANRASRETFYTALVKAEGKAFADRIIADTLHLTAAEFQAKAKNLQASHVKRVLDAVEVARHKHEKQTYTDVSTFIHNGNLDSIAQVLGRLEHPGLDPHDPEIEIAFRDAVGMHPDLGHREFTREDLNDLAKDAVFNALKAKRARFDEQYPHLARLENGHFHDIDTYFDALPGDLDREPLSRLREFDGFDGTTASWIRNATARIQEGSRLLGETEFDPERSQLLLDNIDRVYQDAFVLALDDQVPSLRLWIGESRVAADAKAAIVKSLDVILTGPSADKARSGVRDAFEQFRLNLRDNDTRNFSDPDVQEELVRHLAQALDAHLANVGLGEVQRASVVEAFSLVAREELAHHPTLPELRACRDGLKPMCEVLRLELERMKQQLQLKKDLIDQYRRTDPLSPKAMEFDKQVWMEASSIVLAEIKEGLERERAVLQDTGEHPGRLARIDHDLAAIQELQNAPWDRRSRAEGEERDRLRQPDEPDLRGDLDRDAGMDIKSRRARVKAHREQEKAFLNTYLRRARVKPPGTAGELLDQARPKALQRHHEWNTVRREMMVTRDGLTRTYVSEITPGGKVGGLVKNYSDELRGVSAGDTRDPDRARNLQVSTLYQVDSGDPEGQPKLRSEVIRHGVLESWGIDGADARRLASSQQAREVVLTAIERSPRTFTRPGRDEPAKLVHVNIGLSTSDPSGRRLDRNEGEFLQHQIDAFELLNRQINVGQEHDDIYQQIPIDVEAITFSFAVSGARTDSTRFDEHDRQNLIKLVGDLTSGSAPGGHVGTVVDSLQERIDDPDTPPEERAELRDLVARIRREVDTAREEFTSGDFRDVRRDPYRMVRTIMRVVDLTAEGLRRFEDPWLHMSISQGCRTNVEGGGMADVEHKAQVIIEDMGGRVRPGRDLVEEQDRRIYNTVLTSSGQIEANRMATGLGGSAGVGAIAQRSGDADAIEYARGLGARV